MHRIEKKKSGFGFLPFIIGLLAGAIIIFFIKDYYDKNNSSENKNVVRLTKQADDLLSQFIELQNLNEKYATMLADKNLDSSGLKSLDSLNISITNNQFAFRQILDSLQSKKDNYDENSYVLLIKITDAYLAALNQSTSINTTRSSVTIGNTNYSFDQNMLNAMQNELREKQLQVINLSAGKDIKSTPSSDYAIMLKQQDSVVTNVLKNQRQKNKNLTDYSNKLKSDNDRLSSELQSLRESNTSNQVAIPASVTTTQLSEQLDLAKVDCYLARADVEKIISNSKQRRDLLQQALNILNSLIKSSSATIREQAQQKSNELKTIAANNHD